MLRSRLLSTFTVIGVILIALGFVGLIIGPRFIYDPGQPVTGKEAWYYLIIGILMVINGLLTPPHPEEKTVLQTGKKRNGAAPVVSPQVSQPPKNAVPNADKSRE